MKKVRKELKEKFELDRILEEQKKEGRKRIKEAKERKTEKEIPYEDNPVKIEVVMLERKKVDKQEKKPKTMSDIMPPGRG